MECLTPKHINLHLHLFQGQRMNQQGKTPWFVWMLVFYPKDKIKVLKTLVCLRAEREVKKKKKSKSSNKKTRKKALWNLCFTAGVSFSIRGFFHKLNLFLSEDLILTWKPAKLSEWNTCVVVAFWVMTWGHLGSSLLKAS